MSLLWRRLLIYYFRSMNQRCFVFAILLFVCVVPPSWAQLPLVCAKYLGRPIPPGDLEGVSQFRRTIIDTAAAEIGIVSDSPGEDGFKTGWAHLIDYFKVSWPDNNLDFVARTFPKTVTRRDMLKTPVGKGETKISEWCGIFALWAVKTASRKHEAQQPEFCGPPPVLSASSDFRGQLLPWTEWRNGHIEGLPYRSVYKKKEDGNRPTLEEVARRKADLSGLQPGDIVLFDGDGHHQAIVERVSGTHVFTIDGNTYCQLVSRQVHDIDKVVGYYSVD